MTHVSINSDVSTTTPTTGSVVSKGVSGSSSNGASLISPMQTLQIGGITKDNIILRNQAGQATLALSDISGKVGLTTQYQAQLLHTKATNENVQTIMRLFDRSGALTIPIPERVSTQMATLPVNHVRYAHHASPNATHEVQVGINSIKGNRIIIDNGNQLTTLHRQVSSPPLSVGQRVVIAFSPNQSQLPAVYLVHANGTREAVNLSKTESTQTLSQFNNHQRPSTLSIPVSVTQQHASSAQLKLPLDGITVKLHQSATIDSTSGPFQVRLKLHNETSPFVLTTAAGKDIPIHINKNDYTKVLSNFLHQQGTISVSGKALTNILNTQANLSEPAKQALNSQPWLNIKLSADKTLVVTTQQQLPVAEIRFKPGQEHLLAKLNLAANTSAPVSDAELPIVNDKILRSNEPSVSLRQLMSELQRTPGSGAELLTNIKQALATTSLANQDALHSKLLSIAQQLPSGLMKGQANDHQLLQQLITSPTQNLLPITQLNQVPSPIISGLVQMIQVAMAARFHGSDNLSVNTRYGVISSKSGEAKVTTKEASPVSGKHSNLSKAEQQSVQAASHFLKAHQHAKLESADKLAKGIEQLHYHVPYQDGDTIKQAELLIKRERDQQATGSPLSTQHWQLSMTLDVGHWGPMLAKVKLNQQALTLKLFVENQDTLQHVKLKLPLLTKRLETLGFTIAEQSCQQGKIPSSLIDKPYQLFEAYA